MAEFGAETEPSIAEETRSEEVGGTDEAVESYPIAVIYCGVCGLPPEYCEFGSTGEECRTWARENCPQLLAIEEGVSKLGVDDGEASGNNEGGRTQSEGAEGRGAEEGRQEGEGKSKKKEKKVRIVKPGKKAVSAEQRIVIGRLSRNRRKFVTVVGGLDTFPDVKIKDAAKKIGKQFACGSSVSKAPSGAEEVVIQGDVLADLPDFLETTFNIPATKINFLPT